MRHIIIFMIGISIVIFPLINKGFAQGEEDLVAKGKEVYTQRKCSLCHTIEGVGGKMGPDLSDEGNKGRDEEWLIKYFKDPKSIIPEAKMPPVKGTDEELKALATYVMSLKKAK